MLSNYCNKINVIKENKTILKIKKKGDFPQSNHSQIKIKCKIGGGGMSPL